MAWDGELLQTARRFATALQKTQFYSKDRMQSYQHGLLERVVRHARAEVPFYKTRLDPLFGSDDTIRWQAWADIPTFTRADAQEAGSTLFARSTPPKTGGYGENTTSGSTGMPLRTRSSKLMSIMSACINQRLFNWHNIDMENSIAFILDTQKRFPFPDGGKGDSWNLVNPQAPAYNLSVGYTIDQQVDWLMRKQPDILYTHPKNAQATVERFLSQNLPLPFHTIMVHGEVVGTETSQLLSKVGIKLINRFSTVEVGPISGQCSHGPWHHQHSDVCLMEAVRPSDGKQINSGRGELIVTPFYNYAMPLIRYKNGDLLDLSTEPCPCGRTLPRIDRILGRERNMLTFSDGSRVWPNILRSEYERYVSVKQFQMIQHTPTRLEMRYVAEDPSRPVDVAGLTSMMQNALHPDITIDLTLLSDLPRAPSGKFETWISHVVPGKQENSRVS